MSLPPLIIDPKVFLDTPMVSYIKIHPVNIGSPKKPTSVNGIPVMQIKFQKIG